MDDGMATAELLEDSHDEPTHPGTASGIRLRQMHTEEGSMLRNGRRLLAAFALRNTGYEASIFDRMTIIIDSIEKWSLCEPNPDVRERIVEDYEKIMDGVFHKAAGNR